MHAKLKTINVSRLLEDFDLLLNTELDNQPIRLLGRAIHLSAHLLTQYPSLLWEQLYGRLMLYEIPEIQAILAQSPKSVYFRPISPSLAIAGNSLICALEGHFDTVTAIAMTPNGKQALSASNDGTFRFWDLKAGKCIKTLDGHDLPVRDIVVLDTNRDWAESGEQWFVSASTDRTVKLWNLETGRCLKNLSEYSSGTAQATVTTLAVTTDNQILLALDDGTIRIWNLQTDEQRIFINTPGFDRVHSHAASSTWKLHKTVAITADGSRALASVFSIDNGTSIEFWNLQIGTCEHPKNLTAPEALHWGYYGTLAITPDGNYAMLGTFEGMLQRWNLRTGECQSSFQGHNHPICALAISHDGRQAISTSYGDSNILKLWDLQTVNDLETFEYHRAAVTAVAICPQGKQAVSASDRDLKIWNLQTGACQKTIDLDDVNTTTPLDNEYWATETISDLKLYALQRACQMAATTSQPKRRDVEISTDGSWGLIARSNTLRLLNFQTGMDQELDEDVSLIEAMAVSSDGKWAAIGLKNRNLKIWNLQKKDCQLTLERINKNWFNTVVTKLNEQQTISGFPSTFDSWKMQIKAVAISPNCEQAIVGCGYTLELWNLQTKNFKILAASYEAPLQTSTVMFTSDCRKAISTSKDRTVNLWDLINGECTTTWGGDSPILSCAISSDGTTVIAGEEAGRLHFLKLEGV